MHRACRTSHARVVLLPRNARQGELIQNQWPDWFRNNVTIIPSGVVNGLNRLWHSDLVVSGGGTMNQGRFSLRLIPRKERKLSADQLIPVLAKKLQAAARRGFSTTELLEVLASKGLTVHVDTVRAALKVGGRRAVTSPVRNREPRRRNTTQLRDPFSIRSSFE